jgi:2'-5' RNA ligase
MNNSYIETAKGTEYEYLLILSPDESVWEKIMEQKKQFAEKYDCPSCLYAEPHITLVKFTQYTAYESRVLQRIRHYANTLSPIDIALNGFGCFPTHTIYINVTTKNEIIETVKGMRHFQPVLKPDKDHKPHFITEPHITLARKLQAWQYEKGWLEWQHNHFSAKFSVNKMTLLKRKNESNGYKVVETFSFMGKKEKVRQGMLFA